MAKKSARKEITKINLKQAALEGLSYERACETAKRAGKPSYRFTVGDKVQVGHLLNCVVDEALEGGYMYLIRSGANSDNYSCWAWTNVRPLDDDKDTHFAKRNSALSRLHYSNRSMYSLPNEGRESPRFQSWDERPHLRVTLGEISKQLFFCIYSCVCNNMASKI